MRRVSAPDHAFGEVGWHVSRRRASRSACRSWRKCVCRAWVRRRRSRRPRNPRDDFRCVRPRSVAITSCSRATVAAIRRRSPHTAPLDGHSREAVRHGFDPSRNRPHPAAPARPACITRRAPRPTLRRLRTPFRLARAFPRETSDHRLEGGRAVPFDDDLQAIHIPGHCAGQLAFLWRRGRRAVHGRRLRRHERHADPRRSRGSREGEA